MSNEKPKAPFVTFYSFKGGVGRSMALINTAGILAGRGFKVLVIDLDLEAPGLSYLNPDAPDDATQTTAPERPCQSGFVDLLSDAKERGVEADFFKLSVPDIAKLYTRSYKLPDDLRDFPDGSLNIMPAGKFDSSYMQRCDALNLRELYQQGLGEPLIRAFKKKISESGVFDYVLVDSRTGFSDEAGICTRDLPDLLMILSGLNHQNVEGTSQFLKALRGATDGKAKFKMILSPVPNGEDALMDEREAAAKEAFEKAWGSEIDLSLQIPYHPQLALTEEPHIFRRRRGYLFDAYRKIERSMLSSLGHDAATLTTKIEETIERKDIGSVLDDLRRLVRLDRGSSHMDRLASHLVSSTKRYLRAKEPGETDQERAALDGLLCDKNGHQVVEFIMDHLSLEDRALGARALLDWLTKNSVDMADRLHKRMVAAKPNDAVAMANYAIFLENQFRNHDGANTYFRRSMKLDSRNVRNIGRYAICLEQRGDKDGAEALFRQAIEAEPKNVWALRRYAFFLANERGEKDGAEALYKRAVEANDQDAWTLAQYAAFLEKQRGDNDGAEALYKRAIEADASIAWNVKDYAVFLEERRGDKDGAQALYKKAIATDPKDGQILMRYAIFLQDQRGDDDGAEKFYKRAIEADPKDASLIGAYALFLDRRRRDIALAEAYFKAAVEVDSKQANNLGNYGQLLVGIGRLDVGEKALLSALKNLDRSEALTAGEVCFSLWIVSRMKRQDALTWERGFKFMIQQGFERKPWDFDRMLEQAQKTLQTEEFKYAKALAAAFLDASKVAALEQYDRWRALEPLDPMSLVKPPTS